MIQVIEKPIIEEIGLYDIILFPMGINNAMNRGLAYELKLNFPSLTESINKTPYCDRKKYGTIHCVKINNVTFGACFIHNGGFSKKNGEYINYGALSDCLSIANKNFKGKKVACPIMGTSKEDGNGDREKILTLFNEKCRDLVLTLYDYEQKDFNTDVYIQMCKNRHLLKEKKISYIDYRKRMDYLIWIKKHGILNPMPDSIEYENTKKTFKKIKVTKELLKN